MKFALVNPNWDFSGSTYFGCRDPHVPLELMFAFDQIRIAGHEPLLIDAQTDHLTIDKVKPRIAEFRPDFLVIPTAPSYLFWRCPPPELRIPMEWFSRLGEVTGAVLDVLNDGGASTLNFGAAGQPGIEAVANALDAMNNQLHPDASVFLV